MPHLPLADWRDARSLADLGELMARFLEGAIDEAPTFVGRPDPETDPLVAVLAQVNRAGYVTTCSQPVDPRLGLTAFVVGVCSETTARGLCEAVVGSGLTAAAVSPSVTPSAGLLAAGDRVLGLDGPGDDVSLLLDAAPNAGDALAGAWQLIVADPDPATDGRLWTWLAAALAATAAAISEARGL